MIKAIIFDWGSTLGKPQQRRRMIYGNTLKEKLSALDEEAINILKYLKKKYKIGLLSNTKLYAYEMIYGLKNINLLQMFDKMIYSSEPFTCSKPCKYIFLSMCKKLNLKPSECVYIGNRYYKDIVGAQKVGMNAIHFIKYNPDDKFNNNSSIVINNLNDLKKYL